MAGPRVSSSVLTEAQTNTGRREGFTKRRLVPQRTAPGDHVACGTR